MNTNNSLSTIIKQFLEMHVNSMKSFERINEAVVSDKDSVQLEVLSDEDGGTKVINIPGFGYMKRELERLDRNVKSISGLGDGTSMVKLSDGTYQRLVTSKLNTPANDLASIRRPSRFQAKSNYFFEDFLTPLLTVNFDVSGQMPIQTERVLVKRFVFDSAFQFATEFFDETYKDLDDIDYQSFIEDLANNNIPFFEDEEVRDMPYRSTQYYGTFDVTSIDNAQRTVVVDGESVQKNIKLYTLDRLTYTDGDKDVRETEFLQIGDEVIVNSLSRSTKYRIKSLISSSRQVELELVEGYEAVKIGADVLKIYKANDTQVQIEINVGFNERVVVFFKPIDPDSKILAENWSPGASIWSNELTVEQADGSFKTLADYYKEEVADFGQFIRALKDDAIPPATLGAVPSAPNLIEENFQVVQINTHLTENDAVSKVKKLSNDKVSVDESIKKLDDNISKKREVVSTKKYKSTIERDRDRNELNALSSQRQSEVNLYSSLVNQIRFISSDSQVNNIQPKYRIRGFWPIPEPKLVADTIPQEVVQFIVQYRYLSTSGKASSISQIPFNDGEQTRTGVFSNWNEIKSGVRNRVRDEQTGKFVWSNVAVEDGQEVNFNQLDIAIQSGETVEIRIKSVSEAGWPGNPISSDWSNIIRVNFPEGGLDTASVVNLVEQNSQEVAKVKLIEELQSRGVYRHVDDTFIANEKYFAHSADSISSGFLTPEQAPINLFDKLNDLQNQISLLQETIQNIKGELKVTLVKEDGTIVNINRNTVNKVFAGYYTDEVAELEVKKGHIVTKTFKLLLENTRSTPLELIARISGDRDLPVFKSDIASNGFGIDPSSNTVDQFVINDTYYRNEAKYDQVPVQYQNLSASDLNQKYQDTSGNLISYNSQSPYQSVQRRGQFVYSRFKNVSNDSNLYINNPGVLSEEQGGILPYEHTTLYETGFANSGDVTDFIWAGTFKSSEFLQAFTDLSAEEIDGQQFLNQVEALYNSAYDSSAVDLTKISTITKQVYDSGIVLHKDHPDLQNLWTSFQAAMLNAIANADPDDNLLGFQILSVFTTFIDQINSTGIYSMPRTAPIKAEAPYGKNQLAYLRYNETDQPDRSVKMSFDANDQYLLGGKSCGSFLFISPINPESLVVNGDNKFGRKIIENGESNAVSIDVVFQYRMTDYSGNNPAADLGLVGGTSNVNISNLTYAKKIGIDVFDLDDEQFSFDLEVFSKYKAEGSNQNSISAAQLVG